MDWLDAVVAGPESGQQSIDKRNNAVDCSRAAAASILPINASV